MRAGTLRVKVFMAVWIIADIDGMEIIRKSLGAYLCELYFLDWLLIPMLCLLVLDHHT